MPPKRLVRKIVQFIGMKNEQIYERERHCDNDVYAF